MLQSNFKGFVDQFKEKNPKQDFERNFLKIVQDIKAAIIGVKEVLVSPQKNTISEKASHSINEIEKQNDASFNVESDNFSDIKSILSAIEINTSRDQLKLEDKSQEPSNFVSPYSRDDNKLENRDNFVSSDEREDKNDKFIIDMEKKQFLMQKEQLDLVREIRDTLKPKVPGELEEHKAKPIDLFAFNNEESKSNLIPDVLDRGRMAGVMSGSKGKNAPVVLDKNGKAIKPKTSALGKVMKGAKIGLGAAAIAGAGYFVYDTVKQFNHEIIEQKTKEIDEAVARGEILPEEAEKMKAKVIADHEKEMVKVVTEEGGGFAGSIAGAAMGAKIGSFAGPIGALGGGILGSVVGGFAGTELGKQANDYLKDKDVGQMVDDVKVKASGYFDKAKEKFEDTKKYIQTDMFPEGSKKIEKFIESVKEEATFDNVKSKVKSGLDSIKSIFEPEKLSQTSKIVGEQSGKFIENATKMAEDLGNKVAGESKTLVNNIVNSQSNNNFIPMKATPRTEYTGSALDRYTDKLSNF